MYPENIGNYAPRASPSGSASGSMTDCTKKCIVGATLVLERWKVQNFVGLAPDFCFLVAGRSSIFCKPMKMSIITNEKAYMKRSINNMGYLQEKGRCYLEERDCLGKRFSRGFLTELSKKYIAEQDLPLNCRIAVKTLVAVAANGA